MTLDEREIKKHGQMIAIQRSIMVLGALALVMTLGILVFDAINGIRDREYLIDCTTPGGKCFQESQGRTGEALDAIFEHGNKREEVTREIVVLAAYCAQQEEGIAQIERCIKGNMEE